MASDNEIAVQVAKNSACVIGKPIPLIDILSNKLIDAAPFNFEYFKAFCKKEFVTENIDFYEAVEVFRSKFEDSAFTTEYVTAIKYICGNFINEEAIHQVNINESLRNKVKTEVLNSISCKTVEPHIFDQAQKDIFNLMNTDVYPRYMKYVRLQKQLNLAKKEALWFLESKWPTFKEFTTFPNPINAAESRVHSFCTVFLLLASFLLDYYCGIGWIYVYLAYDSIFRFLFGPRLSIQSMVVLFFLTPCLQYLFNGWPEDKFVSSPSKRFAIFVAACFSSVGLILRFMNLFMPDYVNLLIPSYIVYGIWFIAATLVAVFNLCIACIMFQYGLAKGWLPPTLCEECNIIYVNSESTAKLAKTSSVNSLPLVKTPSNANLPGFSSDILRSGTNALSPSNITSNSTKDEAVLHSMV